MAGSAPLQVQVSTPKACWDDTNTGIFLEILIEEIEAENRPTGHFTKAAWYQIVSKFCQSSGCQFSVTQLRNKFDNMKKEFRIWEKLRNDEIGLGYDRATNRIIADPIWWRQKIQDFPEYKRFKMHGPILLEMQERVFKGIVATGYMEYRGQYSREQSNFSPIETIPEDLPFVNLNDADGDSQPTPVNVGEGDIGPSGLSQKQNTRKRRRSRSTNGDAANAEVNNSLLKYINALNEKESMNSPKDDIEKVMIHTQVIQLLRSLPWIDVSSPYFSDCLLLFKEVANRVTFANIVDLGEQVIKDWIYKEMKYSYNS